MSPDVYNTLGVLRLFRFHRIKLLSTGSRSICRLFKASSRWIQGCGTFRANTWCEAGKTARKMYGFSLAHCHRTPKLNGLSKNAWNAIGTLRETRRLKQNKYPMLTAKSAHNQGRRQQKRISNMDPISTKPRDIWIKWLTLGRLIMTSSLFCLRFVSVSRWT